jgi:hypothetical protein
VVTDHNVTTSQVSGNSIVKEIRFYFSIIPAAHLDFDEFPALALVIFSVGFLKRQYILWSKIYWDKSKL